MRREVFIDAIWTIVLLVAILLFPIFAYPITSYPHTTHWAFTDEPIEIVWDTEPNATEFHFRFYSVERKMYFVQGKSPNNEVQVYIPKTGHFIFEVRSCTDKEHADLEKVESVWCTEWSKTDMPDRVKDQETFWIYIQRAAPTGVGFQ